MKALLAAALLLSPGAGAAEASAEKALAECRKEFAFDSFFSRLGTAKAFPTDFGEGRLALLLDATWYHICAAVAERSAARCGPLDQLAGEDLKPFDTTPKLYCEEYFFEMNMRRDLVSGAASCRENLLRTHAKPVEAANVAPFCAVLIERPDAKSACAKLAPLFKDEKTRRHCPAFVDSLRGRHRCDDPADAYSDEKHFDLCGEWKDFSKALERGPKACRGPFCRVFLGAGMDACAPLKERAAKGYCSSLLASRKAAK
jgi:hypothetical protein